MEFYAFMRGLLAWMASVALVFPVNVPMLYFAHRIREGQLPEDDEHRLESDELWTRAALGSLAVAGTTLAFLFLDVLCAEWMELGAIVHFVVLLTYVPAAAFVLVYFFAYDDYFFGLSLLTLYLGLPMLVLYLVTLVVPVWGWWVKILLGFLVEPK